MSKDSISKEEDDFETPTMSFESFLTYDAPTPVKKKKKPSSSSSSTSHSQPSHSASPHHKSTAPPVPSSTSSSSKAKKANGNKRRHSESNSVEATPQKRKRVRNPVHAEHSLYFHRLAAQAQPVTLEFLNSVCAQIYPDFRNPFLKQQ